MLLQLDSRLDTSSSVSTTRVSPFFRLPIELRTHIYAYALASGTIHIWRDGYDRIYHGVCMVPFKDDEAYAFGCIPYPVPTSQRHMAWRLRQAPHDHLSLHQHCMYRNGNQRTPIDARWCSEYCGQLALDGSPWCKYHKRSRSSQDRRRRRTRLDLRLLSTCRQIYAETRLMPFTTNRLAPQDIQSFTAFVGRLMPVQLAAIRNLLLYDAALLATLSYIIRFPHIKTLFLHDPAPSIAGMAGNIISRLHQEPAVVREEVKSLPPLPWSLQDVKVVLSQTKFHQLSRYYRLLSRYDPREYTEVIEQGLMNLCDPAIVDTSVVLAIESRNRAGLCDVLTFQSLATCGSILNVHTCVGLDAYSVTDTVQALKHAWERLGEDSDDQCDE